MHSHALCSAFVSLLHLQFLLMWQKMSVNHFDIENQHGIISNP